MSQDTTTQSGEVWNMQGSGSGTLNSPPLSGEAELKETICNDGSETNNIRHLLQEMSRLYEQRLRCLELDSTLTGEERLQKEVDFLRSYVNDFAAQNQVLVQTIEELQKETNHKCSSWRMKLCTYDRNLNVSEVDLRTLLLDDLNRPAAHIPQNCGSPVHITGELAGLNIHLQNREMVESDVEPEMQEHSESKLKNLQSELSCLQQILKDNVMEITEKDICITKLQANVQLLQQEAADYRDQLDVRGKELQEELKRKEEEWRQREDKLKVKYEKECQKAEERGRQEQQRREGEWVKRVEEGWKRKMDEERQAHAQAVKSWTEKIKEREELMRQLDQDVVCSRASQDCLKQTLAGKEKHAQELLQDNAQLKENLATLQSKLQRSECMLSHISESLDQTKSSLKMERQQKQQFQDQLQHSNKEAERLQKELTQVHHTAEKKIQKREIKICALVKELTESKKQHSKLLNKDKDLEKLCEERDELKGEMEAQSRECVHLNQTRERLEADLSLSHEKLHTSHLEVRSRDRLILQLRAEIKAAELKHKGTEEQVASLEDEVRHLNCKVKGHQEEASQLSRKFSDIERLKELKEKEEQELRDQLHISQQQLFATHKQLKGAREELKNAGSQAQEQKESLANLKQDYTAAIAKVQVVQGQVERLEEELFYSQQQLRESQLASHSVKKELAELERRYQEKVGQWESSREALDQLTDELQANQNLLRESQQKVEHFRSLMESLQAQVDTLKQQKLMLECDLQLYQQNHSHSDDEYLNLATHSQQLQEHCTEQVERLAECEKAILQMKSELERQTKEKADLKQSLASSHHAYLSNCSHLEQEVSHLRKKIGRLELELADTQKVRTDLLRQSEEELKGARQEVLRRGREVEVHRGEVQRLQDKLQKEEDKMRSAIREKQSLNTCIRQLSQEVEELRSRHQVTVEELAARAEEARQMEGCLNEGKLAEEKIRSMARSLEMEVAELRKNLQEAVDQKVMAEREKQDAQDQVEIVLLELEGARSDNANLRRESQMVMTNINQWISEQKASSESLMTQMKAQNKLLLIVTDEREQLQEANDTLKAEVEGLKQAVDEKERDMEGLKAQIRDQSMQLDNRIIRNQDCVALNLSKIEDMQTRMRSNLEAIGTLNQQLNILSTENKQLRRQLDEETSMRRQIEQLLRPPPISQQCSTIHLPISQSAHLPPNTTSFPSFFRPSHPLSLDPTTRDTGGLQTQAKLSESEPERSGESHSLSEAFWIRTPAECSISAPLEDIWSGKTSRDLTK